MRIKGEHQTINPLRSHAKKVEQALQVVCPTCKQPPGKRCRDVDDGGRAPVHERRIYWAEEFAKGRVA